ncbi:hypothetical protein TURU_166217 [Turdus rufiventris]|nr:hypothetical protein TURU_166217 [Turdus rufiventris]
MGPEKKRSPEEFLSCSASLLHQEGNIKQPPTHFSKTFHNSKMSLQPGEPSSHQGFNAYKWKSRPDLHLNDAMCKKKEVLEGLEASGPSKKLGGAAGWARLPVPKNQPALPGAPEEEGHCTPQHLQHKRR